jgi:hypothetical protein
VGIEGVHGDSIVRNVQSRNISQNGSRRRRSHALPILATCNECLYYIVFMYAMWEMIKMKLLQIKVISINPGAMNKHYYRQLGNYDSTKETEVSYSIISANFKTRHFFSLYLFIKMSPVKIMNIHRFKTSGFTLTSHSTIFSFFG